MPLDLAVHRLRVVQMFYKKLTEGEKMKKEAHKLLIGASLMTLMLVAPVKINIDKSHYGIDITVISADAFARGGGGAGLEDSLLPAAPICGTQSRDITCVDYRGRTVSNTHCANGLDEAIPGTTQSCGDPSCSGATAEDPLVFDLDGNGISLVSADDGVLFDMDNDGVEDQTGWVSNTDGLLALDENNNGVIDNQSELFGSSTSGSFQSLARHDSNEDGLMNNEDRVWNRLRMWVDADSDGDTDEGELKRLSDFNITEIDLGYNIIDEINAGNAVTGRSNFTRMVEGVGQVVAEVIETFFNFFRG